ncbi:radical SAM protein [Bacillus pseudomycoides]|nr:radical SAM protein [Bacillus cereus group sp. N21]OOR51518.1 radical SAM protein [Bacillus pseudomycoides]PDX99125.1 radical SAM protein [Bacillus pseudomycoides]PDY11573.1 radical SAM protein [Bacillus pseudomycoides]PEE06405.1 radical SAM protein [Bacillus pseudomycoides]
MKMNDIADHIFINQDYEFQWLALHEEEDDGKDFCYDLRNQAVQTIYRD